MKEFTLISMVDFVLELNKIELKNGLHNHISDAFYFSTSCIKYAHFLKKPLKLEMFVPCDDEGNVIEKPLPSDYDNYDYIEGGNIVDYESYSEALEEYSSFKDKVLFNGFELVEKEEVYDSIRGIWIDLESRAFQIEGSLGVGCGNLIDETISDLVYLNLILTDNAISQIFGSKEAEGKKIKTDKGSTNDEYST